MRTLLLLCCLLALPLAVADRGKPPADPLPSWNDGPSKKAIVAFVRRVTTPGGKDFVPAAERIATFDNDGTLWSEQPMYFEVVFAIDQLRKQSAKHPEWKKNPAFLKALAGDGAALLGSSKWFREVYFATHSGMTTAAFDQRVEDWLKTARHPRFKRPYTDLVYQPMLELLAYLRQSGFKTYIVSGGGLEFMRVWAPKAYGIPPEQIVGTSVRLKYELRDGKPILVRLAGYDLVDNGPGKPVGIQRYIGRRPILAFGNSDGDYEMLRWTTAGPGPRLGLIVHHTDATREWSYDRKSLVGRLDKALSEAPQRGWVVVDMKKEWKVIYPFEKK